VGNRVLSREEPPASDFEKENAMNRRAAIGWSKLLAVAILLCAMRGEVFAVEPVFVSGPSASPNRVTGTTTDLTVVVDGPGSLTYTWRPPAPRRRQ
jgi:hypothetical protein